jgi:hypothetical protein
MLTKLSSLLMFILLSDFISTAQVRQRGNNRFIRFDEVEIVPYKQWKDMDTPWADTTIRITNKDIEGKWVLTKIRIWRGGPKNYLLNGQTKTNHKDTLEFAGDVIKGPASNFKNKFHFTLSHNLILTPNNRKSKLDTTTIIRYNLNELILSSGPDSEYSRRYYIKVN